MSHCALAVSIAFYFAFDSPIFGQCPCFRNKVLAQLFVTRFSVSLLGELDTLVEAHYRWVVVLSLGISDYYPIDLPYYSCKRWGLVGVLVKNTQSTKNQAEKGNIAFWSKVWTFTYNGGANVDHPQKTFLVLVIITPPKRTPYS